MTEDQAKEFKNLLRYQCKALDALKEDIAAQVESMNYQREDAKLERTSLEIVRTHTKSLALNLRGIMVLIRVVLWIFSIQIGLIGLAGLLGGLNPDAGAEVQLIGCVLGVIFMGAAVILIRVTEKVFGENGNASTPLT